MLRAAEARDKHCGRVRPAAGPAQLVLQGALRRGQLRVVHARQALGRQCLAARFLRDRRRPAGTQGAPLVRPEELTFETPAVYVANAAEMKVVLSSNFMTFDRSRMEQETFEELLGNGLILMSNGPRWKTVRGAAARRVARHPA